MAEKEGLFTRLRKQVQRNRYSRNPLVRGSTLLLRTPFYVWQFATDGFYRSTILNRVFRPGQAHLTCNYTKMDRYPEIFGLVREYFESRGIADSPDLRLLSFGCSTGEEAFSLRRYFPHARIVGADISDWNLEQARAKNRDPKIEFVFSNAENLAAQGPYDAIFCMAVLLRVAHRMEPARSSAEIYPIEKFDEQVGELDALLNDNGLLVVHHANYRFCDAAIFPRYEAVPRAYSERDLVPKYGRDNQLLPETDYPDRVFRKLKAAV
jgi:2-polyprenyl-3-methyl-5-hydroxy-6-metoxy-1,4-benzoquinol methylase